MASQDAAHTHTPFKGQPNQALETQRRQVLFSGPEERYLSFEEEQKIMVASTRNLFDFDELVNAASIPKTIVLPNLGPKGFYVTYCSLTGAERNELHKITDPIKEVMMDKRNRKAIAMMIAKANPNIKDVEKKIDGLPGEWVDAILLKIGKENNSFLMPLLTDALRGLNTIQKRKRSF